MATVVPVPAIPTIIIAASPAIPNPLGVQPSRAGFPIPVAKVDAITTAMAAVAPVASLIVGSCSVREYELGRSGDKGSDSNELHSFEKLLIFVMIRGDCWTTLGTMSTTLLPFYPRLETFSRLHRSNIDCELGLV